MSGVPVHTRVWCSALSRTSSLEPIHYTGLRIQCTITFDRERAPVCGASSGCSTARRPCRRWSRRRGGHQNGQACVSAGCRTAEMPCRMWCRSRGTRLYGCACVPSGCWILSRPCHIRCTTKGACPSPHPPSPHLLDPAEPPHSLHQNSFPFPACFRPLLDRWMPRSDLRYWSNCLRSEN